MAAAKIRLSQKEAELISNSDLILTKNEVLQKVNSLLNSVQEQQSRLLQQYTPTLPVAIAASSPKISRGENYKGLPWLMLDYPRVFERTDIFAIRSFFWWGHFFSITLHLSGTYKTLAEQKIIAAFYLLGDFFICIHEDQWEHHFGKDNYAPVETLSESEFQTIVSERSFIKLAKKYPISEWDNLLQELPEDFDLLMKIVQ